ncbi:MAG: hypothetical protein KC464_27055 [Myxococcales bacterium]|nr:hypothetical protein [Myxococcales bacterium]
MVLQVFSAAAAIEAIEGSAIPFDEMYLDHDLSTADIMSIVGEPTTVPTGYVVAEHLCSMPMRRRPADVVVHSCNSLAGAAMVELMVAQAATDGWPLRCVHVPFPFLAGHIRMRRR